MGRNKKHVVTFSWTAAANEGAVKYKSKWIEGPGGRFWVSSIYPTGGENENAAMVFGNENYKGSGMKMLVKEMDLNYKIIQRPPEEEHYELDRVIRLH
jgi:hypothetical protein